jgi:hypothetical protein
MKVGPRGRRTDEGMHRGYVVVAVVEWRKPMNTGEYRLVTGRIAVSVDCHCLVL